MKHLKIIVGKRKADKELISFYQLFAFLLNLKLFKYISHLQFNSKFVRMLIKYYGVFLCKHLVVLLF